MHAHVNAYIHTCIHAYIYVCIYVYMTTKSEKICFIETDHKVGSD